MIYAETFRHSIQEWIEIQHPNDEREWPWRRDSKLYLINFYAVSSDYFTKDTMPIPFISILINGTESATPIIDHDNCLFRGYFEQDSFQLPRRYLLNPFADGKQNMHTNRHSFNPDGYAIKDVWHPDVRLSQMLVNRRHIRHSIYDSEVFGLIKRRLEELSNASGATIRVAENLFDITQEATSIVGRGKGDPDLFFIQAPVVGIVYPINKSHSYRIINGAFVLCKEPVRLAVPSEPCYDEYAKLCNPMASMSRESFMTIRAKSGTTKAVVYLAVEAPNCSFDFQEYLPSETITSTLEDEYVYMLNHHFMVSPYLYETPNHRTRGMAVRLGHTIEESLIQKLSEHKRYFFPQDEKLFKRSDMPPGFHKTPGGKSVMVGMDIPE